jgi:hypothetical protein
MNSIVKSTKLKTGFSVLLLLVLLGACDFVSPAATMYQAGHQTEVVTVMLPERLALDNRFQLTGWLLVREQGGRQTQEILPASVAAVTLEFAKNQVASALFFPLVAPQGSEIPRAGGGLRFFKPAGCIYPYSRQAAWLDGFGAEILLDLLTNQGSAQTAKERRAFCSRFNWQRFQQEIRDVQTQNSVFNPWAMNRPKILGYISSGKFYMTALKMAVAEVQVHGGLLEQGYFQSYIPAPLVGGASDTGEADFSFAYCPSGENLLFDGSTVYLVCPPQHPGATGETRYQLAPMPPSE